jgi:hypothetical protein
MLKYLLNKGGAGVSMTRRQTTEQLVPLQNHVLILTFCYDAAIRRMQDRRLAGELNRLLDTLRVDGGKISEVILSAGGVPASGVGMRQDRFGEGLDDTQILFLLKDREKELEAAVLAENDVKHHIRSQATLALVLEHTRDRLSTLRGHLRGKRRTVAEKEDGAVPETPGIA